MFSSRDNLFWCNDVLRLSYVYARFRVCSFHRRDTSNPRARNRKKSSIRGKCTWLNAGLILRHAILRLRQMVFGLDRVQWKSSSARFVDERANGDTSGQFFTSTPRENRYTVPSANLPSSPLFFSQRFIGALAKSQSLLKLIKRPLFALSAASSRKTFRSFHRSNSWALYWRILRFNVTLLLFHISHFEKIFIKEI